MLRRCIERACNDEISHTGGRSLSVISIGRIFKISFLDKTTFGLDDWVEKPGIRNGMREAMDERMKKQ